METIVFISMILFTILLMVGVLAVVFIVTDLVLDCRLSRMLGKWFDRKFGAV
jgi:hypothetical protein